MQVTVCQDKYSDPVIYSVTFGYSSASKRCIRTGIEMISV